jgi:lipoprotein-anchoring transpeptidase ErfK/SrfK
MGKIMKKTSALTTGALIAGIVAASTILVSAASSAQIYDPSSKTWINYDPKRLKSGARSPATDPRFRRQVVDFRTAELPGTIIIDSDSKFLYLVLDDFKAIRYGVGVGREGFGWSGVVEVGRTAEWPTWTPPKEMIARDPHAAKFADGMPGGPDNPLGARALYLYDNGRDTIYRIHGTNEPWSIGLNISSGCIRLRNEDIEDLYARVTVGAKVIVIMQGPALISS